MGGKMSKEYYQEYARQNKEKCNARTYAWAKRNPEKRKGIVRSLYHRWRDRAIEALGEKCVRCSFNDRRALQIDHVNSDGWADKLRKRNHKGFFKHLVLEGYKTGRYQLLCANCNWIKVHEKKEWQVRYRRDSSGLHGGNGKCASKADGGGAAGR